MQLLKIEITGHGYVGMAHMNPIISRLIASPQIPQQNVKHALGEN